jgi:hypothetical protein
MDGGKVENKKRFSEFEKSVFRYLKKEEEFLFSKQVKEAGMYMKSLNRLFSGIMVKKDINEIKVGEIYMANLLLAYPDDMAYEHPVLVMGKIDTPSVKKIIVIPGTTYRKNIQIHTTKSLIQRVTRIITSSPLEKATQMLTGCTIFTICK